MSDLKNGGPVFPHKFENNSDEDKILYGFMVVEPGNGVCFGGMSIRDYFAIHASDEAVKIHRFGVNNEAEARYKFADEMLKARKG